MSDNVADIAICNKALSNLKLPIIKNFDEGTVEAEVSKNLYPVIKRSLLSFFTWSFNTKFITLSQDKSIYFSNGNVFVLPENCLRVHLICNSKNAKVLGKYIISDLVEELKCYYSFDIEEVEMPQFFIEVFIAQLTAEFCIPLVDDTLRWEKLSKVAQAEINRAISIDTAESNIVKEIRNWLS